MAPSKWLSVIGNQVIGGARAKGIGLDRAYRRSRIQDYSINAPKNDHEFSCLKIFKQGRKA